MKRKSLLISLLAASLVLSGCLAGDDATPADDTSSTDTTTGDQSNTTAPPATNTTGTEPTVNAPPVPTLSADVVSGTAPLLVTFAIGGSDADGDTLSWTLDADGDGTNDSEGTELPGSFAFNFTTPGNYSALLTLSDGQSSPTATLNISITEAATGGGTLPETITFSDTITGLYAVEYIAVEEKSHSWSFDATNVQNMTVSISHDSPGAIDLDWSLYAPDGTLVHASAEFNVPGGANAPLVGETPNEDPAHSVTDKAILSQAGDWRIDVHPGESIAGAYTVTIAFA